MPGTPSSHHQGWPSLRGLDAEHLGPPARDAPRVDGVDAQLVGAVRRHARRARTRRTRHPRGRAAPSTGRRRRTPGAGVAPSASRVSTESVCTSRWTRCLTVFGSGTGQIAMPMPSPRPTTSPGSSGPRPATYSHPVAAAQNSAQRGPPAAVSMHSSLNLVTLAPPLGSVPVRPGSLTRMSQQTPDSTLPETRRLGTRPRDHRRGRHRPRHLVPRSRSSATPGEAAPRGPGRAGQKHPDRRVHTDVVTVYIDLSRRPTDASDAYLRLHLLSHRLVRPHEANLDGIFGLLANVVWTTSARARSPTSRRSGSRCARRARCRSSASTSSPG